MPAPFVPGIVIPVLLITSLLAPDLLAGSAPGVLAAGGGAREGGAVKVQDSLGAPVTGDAAGSGVALSAGFVTGLPEVTPILLRRFHIGWTPEGVVLEWQGGDEARIYGFLPERAEGAAPESGVFQRIGDRFPGLGPHRLVDSDVVPGKTYHYRFRAITDIRVEEIFGPWAVTVPEGAPGLRPQFLPPAPNPFREAVVVRLVLAETATVTWYLADARGRRLLGGAAGHLEPGYHAIRVQPKHELGAGMFFLHVKAGAVSEVQKIVRVP